MLDSAEFYADCRNLLTEDGIMTVNLFGRSSSFDKSLDQMAQAFGEDALWAFRPTREGNTVVLAQRTPRVLQGAELDLACDQVQARWDLNTTRWAKVFVPARDAEAGSKTAKAKVVRIGRGTAE